MENHKNRLSDNKKSVGRPKGAKIVVTTVVIDLNQEQFDKIEALMKKWNIKTRSKTMEKCLDKVYAQESI